MVSGDIKQLSQSLEGVFGLGRESLPSDRHSKGGGGKGKEKRVLKEKEKKKKESGQNLFHRASRLFWEENNRKRKETRPSPAVTHLPRLLQSGDARAIECGKDGDAAAEVLEVHQPGLAFG